MNTSSGTQIPRGRGETLLVAEDTDSVRLMLSEMLEGLGYQVLQAPDVAGAIAVLHGQKIDLLLSDVVMGSQVGGIELARTARSIDPRMKIVLMSGYMEHILPQTGPEICDAVLMKPYRRHELASRVRELLDSREP